MTRAWHFLIQRIVSITTVVALAAGCHHEPDLLVRPDGSRMSRNDALSRAEQLIRDGKQMREQGRQVRRAGEIDRGDQMMNRGDELILQGQKLKEQALMLAEPAATAPGRP